MLDIFINNKEILSYWVARFSAQPFTCLATLNLKRLCEQKIIKSKKVKQDGKI